MPTPVAGPAQPSIERDVERAQVVQIRNRMVAITQGLRASAEAVEREIANLDVLVATTPVTGEQVGQYGDLAQKVLHKVIWDFANLSADYLARDAAVADVYRHQAEVDPDAL